MYFTEEKLSARLTELEPFRYRERQQIPTFIAKLTDRPLPTVPETDGTWQEVGHGQQWQGRDLNVWLKQQIKLPKSWADKRVVGLFDFGDTGGGNNSGFESLLYVDKSPYQGVDSNHKEVFFRPNMIDKPLELAFKLWSGLEGRKKGKHLSISIRQAELAWLDPHVDDLYFTALASLETIAILAQGDPVRISLLKALNGSMNLISWAYPGSDDFYGSIYQAIEALKSSLSKIPSSHPVKVSCLGHSHIDVAWLWRLAHTREKCARTFSTALRLMEDYPDYLFLQSQPQLYEYIKEDYPQIYSQIKKRVAEGRWEPDGAMWVEADCNLISGESLVRQILHGTRFFAEEFGVDCTTLWLPDVFGYSWALPQVLSKSGIDTFITTKISWNQYNRMPHDTFLWRGLDGTEILTHFITTPPGTNQADTYTYNGVIRPYSVQGIWSEYQDKELNTDLLLAYGHGDGGGGVTREMLEHRRRLADMPGLPRVETASLSQFVSNLHKSVAEADVDVPLWDGELYLEYHRGTYTSQAAVKKANRKLEILMKQAEMLMSWQALLTKDWSAFKSTAINQAWKKVLLHQFHDIIPGSSIQEVYQDTLADYQAAQDQTEELIVGAVSGLTLSSDNSYTVFNSSSWQQDALIEIERNDDGVWYCGTQQLAAEKLEDRWLVQVPQVPALGWTTVELKDGAPTATEEKQQMRVDGNQVETPFYSIQWNDNGQLTKVFDKQHQRSVLTPQARGNELQVFEDKPIDYDAWDIDLFYQEKMEEVTNLLSCKVKEANSLRIVISFAWRHGNSTIYQDMVVYVDNPRIDFETKIDWQESQQLLKVAFPLDLRVREATYDIQFGNITRPTHWNTSWDYAKFEVVGHQWADMSERSYGVSLLNDSKYGYDAKGNVLRLTLLKSAISPDETADKHDRHSFVYSLMPHAGDWVAGETHQQAALLNEGIQVFNGRFKQELTGSLFVLDNPALSVDAVKKAEDENALIIRLHEYTGGRSKVTLQFPFNISGWQEVNLLEKPVGKVSNDPISLQFSPYEIRTLKVYL